MFYDRYEINFHVCVEEIRQQDLIMRSVVTFREICNSILLPILEVLSNCLFFERKCARVQNFDWLQKHPPPISPCSEIFLISKFLIKSQKLQGHRFFLLFITMTRYNIRERDFCLDPFFLRSQAISIKYIFITITISTIHLPPLYNEQ